MKKWQGQGYRQSYTPPAFVGRIVGALLNLFDRIRGIQ